VESWISGSQKSVGGRKKLKRIFNCNARPEGDTRTAICGEGEPHQEPEAPCRARDERGGTNGARWRSRCKDHVRDRPYGIRRLNRKLRYRAQK